MKISVKSCWDCPLYFIDKYYDPRCKYPGVKFRYPDYGLDQEGKVKYKEGLFFETNKLTPIWHNSGEMGSGIHEQCPLKKEELLICL